MRQQQLCGGAYGASCGSCRCSFSCSSWEYSLPRAIYSSLGCALGCTALMSSSAESKDGTSPELARKAATVVTDLFFPLRQQAIKVRGEGERLL